MERGQDHGIVLKLCIIWLVIILVGAFWMAGRSDTVEMTVIPQVPRENEPILVTFNLNNPSPEATVTEYQFLVDGKLLQEGNAALAPGSGKTYKYVCPNAVALGEQASFVVRTWSEQGKREKTVSLPPYPAQVWSSFVSFASFSTSTMSSMATMTYYKSSFGNEHEPNVGLIISLTLIALLIFAEISQPLLVGSTIIELKRLRISLSAVLRVLLIIFAGLVFTSLVMILQR